MKTLQRPSSLLAAETASVALAPQENIRKVAHPSGARNIAEGFGRYYHPEFAQCARIAKASEEEVLNHFYRARAKQYITAAEFEDAAHAARKALKAVNGLIRYLEDTPDFGK